MTFSFVPPALYAAPFILASITLAKRQKVFSFILLCIGVALSFYGLKHIFFAAQSIDWSALKFRSLILTLNNFITEETIIGLCLFLGAIFASARLIYSKNIKTLKKEDDLNGVEIAEKGTYGTGRLMSKSEAKEFYGNHEKGLILGQDDKGNFYRFPEHGHILTEAATRQGKGVSVVVVNGTLWSGPVVCLDPKIENFFVWARHRWATGKAVCLLDPLNIVPKILAQTEQHGVHASVSRGSVNILDFVDPQSDTFHEDVFEIAAILRGPDAEKNTSDRFWIDGPTNFLAMVIHWVMASPADEIEGPRTLRTIRDYCFRADLTSLIDDNWAQRDEIAGGALARRARSLSEFKNNAKGYASIAEVARTWLTFLDNDGVMKSLCGEINPVFKTSDILRGHTDIFIGVPLEMLETQPQFARLIISACFYDVMRAHGAVDKRILFMLDEMPRLKYLPVLKVGLAALAGMGASIWAIVQSYSQLEEEWGRDAAKAFFDGCTAYQYFGITPENAERVSKLIGKTTLVDRSTTTGVSDSFQPHRLFSKTESENKGESERHTGRELITPDDLKTLNKKHVVIQTVGEKPLVAKRVKYFEHPHFSGLYDPNPYLFIED